MLPIRDDEPAAKQVPPAIDALELLRRIVVDADLRQRHASIDLDLGPQSAPTATVDGDLLAQARRLVGGIPRSPADIHGHNPYQCRTWPETSGAAWQPPRTTDAAA